MDERDYKAMNEELKKIQPSIELQISNDQLAMIAESEVLKINGMEFISRNKVEKMLVDFANEQLKEKEEETDTSRTSLFTSERFRMEDAATSIDDRNILHAKHTECVKQLTKSKEMNENIGVLLRNANDNSDRLEKWGNELNEKLNRAISAMTKTVQTLSFHGLKSNELNDFLNEYQNSKK